MKGIINITILLYFTTGCLLRNRDEIQGENGRSYRNQTERNIYRAGDSMLAAFSRKDWMTFVQYNHPNMTRRMGGPEAFASLMNEQMKQVPDSNIQEISLGKILQVVKTAKDEQCIVEQHLRMKIKGSEINKTTYLVGESLDNGGTWTFFDASTKNVLSPLDIKPDLSKELNFSQK